MKIKMSDNQNRKNFVWNMIGSISVAAFFPTITVFVTRIKGVELGGLISVAFVTAQMFMMLGNYCMRIYQASDIKEVYSFTTYRLSRQITCAFMIISTIVFCLLRGYKGEIFLINIIFCLVKTLDAYGDVYEGRFQQLGRLDLSGKAQSFRSFGTLVVFAITLILSNSIFFAVIAMLLAGICLTIIFDSMVLKKIDNTFNSLRKNDYSYVMKLLYVCLPLCLSQFIFNYIINSPKYAIEDILDYRYQTYFTALYFPAVIIHSLCGIIYRPFIVRLADWWNIEDKKKIKEITNRMYALIIFATIIGALFMYVAGYYLLGIVYGIDLGKYKLLAVIMMNCGGFIAVINYIYNMFIVFRATKQILFSYALGTIIAIVISPYLTNIYGLQGAVYSFWINLFVITILMIINYSSLMLDEDK